MTLKMKYQTGFTLIELAMVLFILGLLLASFLAPLTAQIEQGERETTQIQLDEIKEVIYGYVVSNGYLPCPDCRDNSGNCVAETPNDGIEDTIDGAGTDDICASEVGNLPWATLGVKETDAWGNRFTYRVDDVFADRDVPSGSDSDGTGCGTATLGVSFELCSDGDITILDSDGGSNVATNVPAIVVSHGKNGTDSITAHEEENFEDIVAYPTDTLKTFVDKDFSDDPVAGFDDMLIWISPYVFRNRMLMSGILP